jgi:tetraacyldisaccharide 4'-kinase
MNLPLALRILLWPFSVVYGGVARLRAWWYTSGVLAQKRLDAAVISVGNLTVGGTGKTPMVLWLAEKFLAQGKRVAILTRGYRGAGGTSDEVALLKDRLQGRVVFGVGRDRYAQGQRLEAQGIDIFLLDDGFQHLRLARDLDIIMIDGMRDLEDEWLLPAGRLREPRSALRRADFCVFTRMDADEELAARGLPQSIFYAKTHLAGFRRLGADGGLQFLSEIAAGPYFAFCGIGNPLAFFHDLRHWGARLAGTRAFRDHHAYTQADVHELELAARKAGAAAFITTEKDSHNLGAVRFSSLPVYVCVIEMELFGEDDFLASLEQKIRVRRGTGA